MKTLGGSTAPAPRRKSPVRVGFGGVRQKTTRLTPTHNATHYPEPWVLVCALRRKPLCVPPNPLPRAFPPSGPEERLRIVKVSSMDPWVVASTSVRRPRLDAPSLSPGPDGGKAGGSRIGGTHNGPESVELTPHFPFPNNSPVGSVSTVFFVRAPVLWALALALPVGCCACLLSRYRAPFPRLNARGKASGIQT